MLERPSEDLRGLWLSLGVYLLIFALKLVAYFLTGVMALFAEALHTLSDIFISGFLLLATYYSRRQSDATHMFGYGRAQNIAALVAATLFISFTSFELYREAIPRLWAKEMPAYDNLSLAFGVIIISMLIAAVPLFKLMAQKQRGAAAKAQLTELINDQLGLLAALLGTLFIAWGWPLADPLAATAVATIIAYNAIGLFRENSSLLLGRSPGPEYLARLERLARSVPGVLDVLDIRAERIGPNVVHVGMSIIVPRRLPVEEADRLAHAVEARIHEEFPSGYCVIHIDPAPPDGVVAADAVYQRLAVG
jgi:cation diffusion facilitator family transporter